MKHLIRTAALAMIIVPLIGGQVLGKEKKISKTFKNIESLEIEMVSGNCVLKSVSGNKVSVEVVYDYPEGCFEPWLMESRSRLRLKERFHGRGTCSGSSEWTIMIPKGIHVEFSSASGDFSVKGYKGEFSLGSASGHIEIEKSSGVFEVDNASGRIEISDSDGEFEIDNASGRIRLQDVSGKFELDNASGDVKLKNARGEFKVDNASGDIDATDIVIEDESSFNTASGGIVVRLAKSPEHDINLGSASGNVVLNYNENPVVGFFEFTARKDRGKIISPYKFDKEEEYEFQGRIYVRKSFTRDKDTPRIILATHSGRTELRLK